MSAIAAEWTARRLDARLDARLEIGCAPGCAPGDWNNDNDSDEKNSLVHQVFVAGPNKH